MSEAQATPDLARIAAELAAPFEATEVKHKPAVVNGNRALALAYIDARLVMDRLDEVIGPANWQDEYEFLPDGSCVCTLYLRVNGEWLAKMDVGGESEQPDEGDRKKAAVSDALKRAAVKWGVGRYLYRLPQTWVDYDLQKKQIVRPPVLPAWALPRPRFFSQLKQYDALVAGRGLCKLGDVVAYVVEKAIARHEVGTDPNDWSPTVAAWAKEEAKAFAKRAQDAKAKQQTAQAPSKATA